MSASSATDYILDASALLAVLLNEPGEARVREVLDRASIHAWNLAEALSKLQRLGAPHQEAEQCVEELHLNLIEELTMGQVRDCAALHAATQSKGLAMGDCVCLTIGRSCGSKVLTTDRGWREVPGYRERVVVIR